MPAVAHPEDDPSQPTVDAEDAASAQRPRRKRKARTFELGDLSQCLCGNPVSEEDTANPRMAVKCKKTGCETVWVSVQDLHYNQPPIKLLQYHTLCIGLELAPRGWVCRACTDNDPKKRRRG